MAYAFRIHEPKNGGTHNPTPAANMSGWANTGLIRGNLLENISIGIVNNKVGTSIPNLFARLFLFEGAFQALNDQADKMLVSECLDMIEFLFQCGNDEHLVVKRWNCAEQINYLQNSKQAEHRKLSKVLSDEIGIRPELGEIFLFYWRQPSLGNAAPTDYLIGGTSPYTMVFTSPNWKRTVKEKNFSFYSVGGAQLFVQNAVSLDDRSTDFKEYLYKLYEAYYTDLSAKSQYFADYIGKSKDGAMYNVDKKSFNEEYDAVNDENGAQVTFCGVIPIFGKKIKPTASGYEIKATSARYEDYVDANGIRHQLDVPLVLNDNGLPGVSYIDNAPWNPNNCKINEAKVRTTPLHLRELPGGMGVQYPFLIWSDFLEDKIIKLPYSINSDRFVTVSNGEETYLLPIKRNFFKYFNIEDLTQNVPGTQTKLVEISYSSNGQQVEVTINVPVKDAVYKFIPLKRTYSGADIVGDAPFVLGFFPFYKVAGNAALNMYKVMKMGSEKVGVSFYSVSAIDNPLQVNTKIRTERDGLVMQTDYSTINGSIDIVEVSKGGATGIILPKMDEKPSQGKVKYRFAVDFGTSNTYIAHTMDINPIPETLEVDAHDCQTVMLAKDVSKLGQSLMPSRDLISREFAPLALGSGAKVSYPSRTAVCETVGFAAETPTLFGNISIGFNMMNETVSGNRNFAYKTGLKWLLEKEPGNVGHNNRVKNYFLQTMWMLKNESYLNGGDDTFDVYITFPETMKAPTRQALWNLWQSAKQDLHLNCNMQQGVKFSESVAPYNCMAQYIGGSSYMNIDIGGGTSDMLFVIKDIAGNITSTRYSSVMFAGDDLWGDGVTINRAAGFNNGFVNYVVGNAADGNQPGRGILGNSGNYPQDLISTLTALKGGIATTSADIMGFVFKHDDKFFALNSIRQNNDLLSIVLIHYAALIYNVSRLIKKMGIDIPEKMSFTGMGSKYLDLLSVRDPAFLEVTKLLLKKYTGKDVPNAFSIIQAGNIDVKEITAKGALQANSLEASYRIPGNTLAPVYDFGFDSDRTIEYQDIAQDEVVIESVLTEFVKFVEHFRDADLKNLLFNRLGLTINDRMLHDLKNLGEQSFRTVSAAIPAAHHGLQVQETLFFWPLKNSLIELSRVYG